MTSVSSDTLEYSLFRDGAEASSLDGALTFQAFGLAIAIRTNHAAVVPRLLEHLPPNSRPSSAHPQRLYTLNVARFDRQQNRDSKVENAEAHASDANPVMLARTHELAEALEIFESDLQLQVAEMCEDKVFVHAGVVGWKGRAIVVPGASTSGKTTLIASLVQAGATYYSDEYALFDEEGRVHPYSRPLRIRTAGGGSRMQCQPELFGGTRGTVPLPLGLIVVTRYRSGVAWQPRKLSPGRSVLALIDNTVSIRRRPHSCLTTLCRNVASVAAIESVRGEADEVAPLILKAVEEQVLEDLGLEVEATV